MTETKHSPVLIIGSGPAGYTAGIYTARAMLKPMLVAGMEQGGQLMITTDVENYPGYAEPVMGPWMMEQMLEQASQTIRQEKDKALQELRHQATDLAILAAGKLLEENLDDERNRKIVDDFIDRISGASQN